MTPSPIDLTPLLTQTLPHLAHGAGRMALLAHIRGIVEHDGALAPSATQLCTWSQAIVSEQRKQAMSNAGGKQEAAHLADAQAAIAARWAPWNPVLPWGWDALEGAVQKLDVAEVARLLDLPGAPRAELNSHKTRSGATPLGAALGRKAEKGGEDSHRRSVVAHLLKLGADPNAPAGPNGEGAITIAPDQLTQALLLEHGGRMGGVAANPMAWMKSTTSYDQIRARLSGWSDALRKNKSPALLEDLQQGWPQIVDSIGARLAREDQGINGRQDVLRQTRALGRMWGQDCFRCETTEPSLPGAWARAVMLEHCFVPLNDSLEKLRQMNMPGDVGGNHLRANSNWKGATIDGLGAGCWGMLMAASMVKARPLNRNLLAEIAEQASPSPQDTAALWENVERAVEKIRNGPVLWRALTELEPVMAHYGHAAAWARATSGVLDRCIADMQLMTEGRGASIPRNAQDTMTGVLTGYRWREHWDALMGLAGMAGFAVHQQAQRGQLTAEAARARGSQVLALHVMEGFGRAQQIDLVRKAVASAGGELDAALLEGAFECDLVKKSKNPSTPQVQEFLLDLRVGGGARAPRPRM